MQIVNTRVVRKSNALLDQWYGEWPTYLAGLNGLCPTMRCAISLATTVQKYMTHSTRLGCEVQTPH